MVPRWLFQRLTTLVASGAALIPACDMLWVEGFTPGSAGARPAPGDFNGPLAFAVGGNSLLFGHGNRPS